MLRDVDDASMYPRHTCSRNGVGTIRSDHYRHDDSLIFTISLPTHNAVNILNEHVFLGT